MVCIGLNLTIQDLGWWFWYDPAAAGFPPYTQNISGIMSDILNQLREAQTLRAYFEAKLQR
ncbi:MAG: hypothetical protein KAS53_02775 [Candidatus Cloacimonetes bacterium]|nr:hypothetical protein [Candidatus Cloacimonadota bacterium]